MVNNLSFEGQTVDIVDFDKLRNLIVGTVEFVSPAEIKVSIDSSAPQNTALNTGTPALFPRINGFVLIPNEVGALVGLISWVKIEQSQFPKRKGYKDFDIIDLPYPNRVMSVSPLGTLKQLGDVQDKDYVLERGVYSFPSVGDSVVLPTNDQLRAIVENKDKNSVVKIGTAPIAGGAEVRVNPDRLFGRHVAILGNTGSGKSCSVAGVIRWSLQAAAEESNIHPLNARFLVLDPNGEYSDAFNDLDCPVTRFKVDISGAELNDFQSLKVPAWVWNSYEWSSFSDASAKTQRPLLKQTLRDLRSNTADEFATTKATLRNNLRAAEILLLKDIADGAQAYSGFRGRGDFGSKLKTFYSDFYHLATKLEGQLQAELSQLSKSIEDLYNAHYQGQGGAQNQYAIFSDFSLQDVETTEKAIKDFRLKNVPELISTNNNEDSPIPFDPNELPDLLDALAEKENKAQLIDFLSMRIRTMLSDARMRDIIAEVGSVHFDDWLSSLLSGIAILDLSLVPSEITHLLVAVLSRVVFESLHRYRKLNKQLLPTVLVMEEAHNFIKLDRKRDDDISATQLCTESFERIAREGRKFGLSLALASQRPSELSPTVLSQCNTFLLHRLVNDRDQELVGKLVPDNIGGLLNELPVLPTRKAILLGWAAPIPILVEMNELPEQYRPDSKDPDFWDVWTGAKARNVDWPAIAADWQITKGETLPGKTIEAADALPMEDDDDIPF